MDIARLFLLDRDYEKLHLLVYLKENPDNSLNSFLNSYDIAYPKMLNAYHKLINDLNDMNGHVPIDTAKLIQKINADDYLQYVMKSKDAYNLLLNIIKHTDASYDDYAERTGTSRAKIYRLTMELRQKLADYGIKLKVNKFVLVGNEILVQFFILNFLSSTRTPLTEFLPHNYITGSESLTRNFQTPVDSRDSLTVQQREMLMGICLLRMSQGYRFQQLPPLWPDVNFAVNKHTSRLFIEYLQMNYHLDAGEAIVQANAINYMFEFEPGFVAELPKAQRTQLIKFFDRSETWQFYWVQTTADAPEAAQLHIISYFINVINLGELPIARRNYIESNATDVVQPGDTERYRRMVIAIFKELGLNKVAIKQVDLLADVMRRFAIQNERLLKMPVAHLVDDRQDIQSDLIKALLKRVVDFGDEDCANGNSISEDDIVIYAGDSKWDEDALGLCKSKNRFNWMEQMSVRQNYERFLAFFSHYQGQRLYEI